MEPTPQPPAFILPMTEVSMGEQRNADGQVVGVVLFVGNGVARADLPLTLEQFAAFLEQMNARAEQLPGATPKLVKANLDDLRHVNGRH